jgi:hypothetical protein
LFRYKSQLLFWYVLLSKLGIRIFSLIMNSYLRIVRIDQMRNVLSTPGWFACGNEEYYWLIERKKFALSLFENITGRWFFLVSLHIVIGRHNITFFRHYYVSYFKCCYEFCVPIYFFCSIVKLKNMCNTFWRVF